MQTNLSQQSFLCSDKLEEEEEELAHNRNSWAESRGNPGGSLKYDVEVVEVVDLLEVELRLMDIFFLQLFSRQKSFF